MRILVDINHPAHVHFFRNFLFASRKMGHDIFVSASDKDVALDLLNEYQIPFHRLPSYGKSNFKKAINILPIDLALLSYAKTVKSDIILGIGSFRAAHVAWWMGSKSFIFDDTEHATLGHLLYRSFATKIFSPSCFYKDMGARHEKYKGYHELAYLHPSRFTPDRTVLREAGIKEGERFFVVRFVSWEAVHDIGQSGLTHQGKKKLVELLSKHGRVCITSEYALDDYFEPFRIKLPPNKIHHLLNYADMYVGEGGTMATESAVLGTPAIFISSLNAGTFADLENNYGLMHSFVKQEDAFLKIEELLRKGEDLKRECAQKRARMLDEKIDVTEWMLTLIK